MSSSGGISAESAVMSGGGNVSWKAFCCGRFGAFHFLLLVLLTGLAYGVQFTVPAYRADDIIQLQPASNDSEMFLILGRWGYYWVFEQLLDTSSGGLAAGFFGLLIQLGASVLLARSIGLKSGVATFFLCAFSTISVHFAYLYSFDSTRLAYPIGNLLAAAGLYLCCRRRPFLGLLCFAASPGFYQASIQVAIAGALGMSLYQVLREESGFDIGGLLRNAFLIFIGLVLYLVGTQVVYGWLNINLARSEMELSTLLSLENWERFARLTSEWSIPFVTGYREEYVSNWIVVPGALVCLCFVYFLCLRTFAQKRFGRGIYAIGLWGVLMVSPFLLALAAPLREDFPPRTLFVFGLVYGILIALPFERLCRLWMDSTAEAVEKLIRRVSQVLAGMAALLLSTHILAANEYAIDDHLASEADLLAINRIIAHIEEMGPASGIDFTRPIPIYAHPQSAWKNAGPRGNIRSARHPAHSRSWIFSFVDSRFDPIFGWDDRAEEARLKPLVEGRPIWPHPDSVFVSEGAVVVVF